MSQAKFLEAVAQLRGEGKGIRTIARELGVHRSRVERALKTVSPLALQHSDHSAPSSPSPMGWATSVFVGRQHELSELKYALDQTIKGQGQSVMLAGEPGIGKTRIAQQMAGYATQRGVQVLWGRCYEDPAMPPYWPWVPLIRAYIRDRDPGELRSLMGAGAADIAELVPEIRERLSELPPPPALEPGQARFRFFDSTATFLAQAAQARPLMLVLDNIHWADRSSLLLLEFLAQELADCRLLLVGTYRDTELNGPHPLNHTLGELARHPRFRRISLRGLSEDEVGDFLRATAGFAPPQELVGAVHAQTEGNPLFLTQVVQLLAQEGRLRASGVGQDPQWDLRVPAGVREVIGRRLARLSARSNQLLVVASVVGREFRLDLLERLMGDPAATLAGGPDGSAAGTLSADDVLAGVEEALAVGVVEELAQSGNRYQFSHVLIRDTLAQGLSSARRARLHRLIAETLEGLYAGGAVSHAAELAYHFMQAAPTTDTEKLVHYSRLAGELALGTYAYQEAITHFECGLAARENNRATDLPDVYDETAAILFGLGRAQAAMANWPEATASLGLAFDHYAGAGDLAKVVSIAELPHLFNYLGQGLATRIIRRALELAPSDSPETSRLLSRYCRALGQQQGDYQAAKKAFERALTLARSQEDTALETRILIDGASVDGFHLEWQLCLGKCLQAIELSHCMDDPYIKQDAHGWAARALYATGELERGRTHSRAILSLSESLRDRFVLGTGLWLNEVGAHLAGEWRIARAFSDRSLALLPADSRFLSTRALLEYQTGDLDEGAAYLERLQQSMGRLAHSNVAQFLYSAMATPVVISLITGSDNDLADMESMAEALLANSTTIPLVQTWARATLALLAVRRHNADAARAQYDHLRSRQSTMLVAGTIGISGDRLLGLVAATMGQGEPAIAHFEDALTFCALAGYRPEYAWSACEYAQTLIQHSASAHRARVVGLLNEAWNIANTLGMRPLSEKVAALQEGLARSGRVGASQRTPPAYPGGLSHREVEVLRLIALGKTNREIADQLVISLNTVVHHVTSILAKTGAANRTEAATYAIRHNLTPH